MNWIKCSDRLPDDGDKILVLTKDMDNDVCYYDGDSGWFMNKGGWDLPATHWMPLPEPPRED